MKRFIIICFTVILTAVFHLNAQEKGIIGFSFSGLNTNDMLQSAELNHDYTTHQGFGFLSLSADYWYPINEWLDFETGVDYSFQSFSETVNNPNIYYLTSPMPIDYDIHMINIPLGIRVNFLKYGFVNSGVLVDLTHEPGIGSYFGVGAKIESEVGFGIFVNPYVKMHSILPVNLDMNVNRIFETGIRFGVSYNFDNILRKR